MSAFEYALVSSVSLKKKAGNADNDRSWGRPMYEWHQSHPDKASRFEQAMQSVTRCMSCVSMFQI